MKYARVILVASLAVLALAAFVACGSGGNAPASSSSASASSASSSGVAITAADRAEAADLFAKRCAACHGPNGEGNGPAAAGLNPKPRNYHDKAWQAATTDEEIEKAIVYGGAAVGKSPVMAANPDLQAKPGVVAALREKVREFAK